MRGCGQSAGMRGHPRHGGGTGRGMPGAPWGKAYLRCWACAGRPRRGRAPIPAHRQAAAAHPDAPPCGFAGGVSEKGGRCCPWPERNDAAMAACAKKITPAPRWRPSGRGAHAAFRETGREAAPCPAAGFAQCALPRLCAALRVAGRRGGFLFACGQEGGAFCRAVMRFFGRERAENTLRGFCRMAFCKRRYSSFSFPWPACRPAVGRGRQSGR